MTVPKFSEDELNPIGVIPGIPGFRADLPMYDSPLSCREAQKHLYLEKEAYWQICGIEGRLFCPRIFPDAVARAWVMEANPIDNETEAGGPDSFGIPWVYEPLSMGSMEDPKVPPVLEDANDWPEIIKFPDIDSWDWEGSAEANNNGKYLKDDLCSVVWIQNGYFERLISFMGFEEASVAMIDEDQEDAVKALMMRLSEFYCDLVDHFVKYFDYIDGFYVHDDWASSLDAFVSPERIKELIVPAMKVLVDHIHEVGCYAELHSCGHGIRGVPNMIEAGWDAWIPQSECNDMAEIYDLYGDQILIGVGPQMLTYNPFDSTEEEQRAGAREYAKRFCNPDKPSLFDGVSGGAFLTPAFREELYVCSRKLYSGESID